MSPEPYWADAQIALHLGDCVEVLAGMDAASVDAVVTDPPAAIGFMGKDWDSNLGSRDRWIGWLAERMEQAARVLKPGGHALVWALPRTAGWTQIALEDAGLEVRDSIAHLFGSGFPKSLDVSKAIDKRAEENVETQRRIAAVAEVIRAHREAKGMTPQQVSMAVVGTSSGACWNWEHQQLPSREMWPAIKAALGIPGKYDDLIEGDRTRFIAAERDVIARGQSGAASIAFAREAAAEYDVTAAATDAAARWEGWGTALKPAHEVWWLARKPLAGTVAQNVLEHETGALNVVGCGVSGGEGEPARWPPNVLLGPRAAEELARQGGASQCFPVFRYEPKAPSHERPRTEDGEHPTVKPVDLMRWLVRLVTPPGGLVLDPFAGSGTTAEACIVEGFRCVLIEKDPASVELIRTRLRKPIQPDMFGGLAS